MKKFIGFFMIIILLEGCYTKYPIQNYYNSLQYQTRANIRIYKHINKSYPHRAHRYQHYRFNY